MLSDLGRFAAAALIGGAPEDYSAGKKPSGHWMVPDVSDDYAVRNDQIPCSLWLIGAQKEEAGRALDYFGASGGLGPVSYTHLAWDFPLPWFYCFPI